MGEETASPARKTRKRGPREFGPLWAPVFLPLMIIGAGLAIPYALGWVAYWRLREKQFAKRMAALGRAMSFDDVKKEVDAGRGTTILEWYSVLKGPVRYWWTPDDVRAISPYPWSDRLEMSRRRFRSSVEWCHRQYTSLEEGKAFFVVATGKQKKSFDTRPEKTRTLDVPTFSKKSW